MWSLEYVYWQCGGSIMVQFYILRNGMRCMAPETEQRCRDAATSQRTTTPDICYGSHGNTCVNFFWPVEIFTDLTRKIGNLLCKFAIYCVNFGVNFILQKFCLCKKMTNMRYATTKYQPLLHHTDPVSSITSQLDLVCHFFYTGKIFGE